MDTLLADLRFAVRSLLKSPGVFAIAALSLALGIAANVTIFAAVDAFLLRPLPYPEPERIVQLWATNTERGWDRSSISLPDFVDWREQSRTMDVAAYSNVSFNLSGGDEPERVTGLRVSANMFGVLGVRPTLGRGFVPEEEQVGRDRVVVVTDALWHRRFGGNPRIVGETILLDGERYTVVGVLPADFRFGSPELELWAPLSRSGTELRSSRPLEVLGRMRPGVTIDRARAELVSIARRLAQAYPEQNKGMSATVISLFDEIYDPTFRLAATICTVAVAFVLLIACANVANLLLARAASRSRELAVRSALGASRGRIARQLLTESLVLALVAGSLGLVLSVWGVRVFKGIMPPDVPRVESIGIDARVLAYTLAISLGAGLLFGIAPALQASRSDLNSTLREGGRSGAMGMRRGRLRASLVVAEVSLALVLLIAAGLLIKSSVRLQTVELGFEPANVLTLRLTLPQQQYGDSVKTVAFHEQLLERVRALPGVTAAGGTTVLPLRGGAGAFYRVEGEPVPEPGREPVVQVRSVTPGYFDAMRIPLVRGRDIGQRDGHGALPIAVINEALARKHWPGRDPVGQRLVFQSGAREIVGIVENTRDFGPDDDAPEMVYFSALQRNPVSLNLVIRTTADPAALTSTVRAQVAALDPNLAIYAIATMPEVVRRSLQGDMIMTKLLGTFGAIALLLAVIGVYGVMAYSVSQRTQEVGVRMALGARGPDILRLILRQGLTLAAAGVVIGLLLAAGTTRALAAFLHGVSTFDWTIFGGVTAALVLSAVVASLIPASRATKVDPLVALRAD